MISKTEGLFHKIWCKLLNYTYMQLEHFKSVLYNVLKKRFDILNNGKIIYNIQITCHFRASQLNAYCPFNKNVDCRHIWYKWTKISFARTSCILLIRFTQNTIVDLINIKRAFVICLLAFAVSPLWALTTPVSLYQAVFVVCALRYKDRQKIRRIQINSIL